MAIKKVTFIPVNGNKTASYTRNTTSMECPTNGILYMKNCIAGTYFLGELAINDFIKIIEPEKYKVKLLSGSNAYIKFNPNLFKISDYIEPKEEDQYEIKKTVKKTPIINSIGPNYNSSDVDELIKM